MKTSFKLMSMLCILCLFAMTSCKKKDMPADDTTTAKADTTAMPAKDGTAVATDTTATPKDASASGKDAYGDDVVSIQKALRTIKEAKVKGNDASDEIVLGTVEKAKRKCATVTFKNGASGRVCASKDAIDRIKTECGNTKDCEVKDAQ